MNCLIGGKTHFAMGESILSPEALVKLAAAAGHTTIAVADGNLNAMPILSTAAKEAGLVYIPGGSVRVVDDVMWRRAGRGQPKATPNPTFSPSLYLRNAAGLQDLLALYTLANDEDHFYHVPQINFDELLRMVARGNVVVTTGSIFSVYQHQEYADRAARLADALVASSLVLEIQPVSTPYFDKLNAITLRWWLDGGRQERLVLSRPVLHAPGDAVARRTMNSILDRQKIDNKWRHELPDSLHPMTETELVDELSGMLSRLEAQGRLHAGEAAKIRVALVDGTMAFASEPMYAWKKMPLSLPNMSADPFKELAERAAAGWRSRLQREVFGYRPPDDALLAYMERLRYELTVLHTMGFESYFLLVAKLTDWCRSQDITVGPGRGSVGGSLVAYLLGITDVDPIRFGLFFERFINPDRLDLPDIDLDFMSSRREEAVQYLIDEFGQENVAGISNYTELGPPSALRQVAAAHHLKDADFECSKLIPKEQGESMPLEEAVEKVADIERFATIYPVIWDQALKLQSTLRSYARHAAGVIVAGEPVAHRAAMENRSGVRVVNWDKRVVEDFGLVKLDILGLSTLDVMYHAKRYIVERTGKDIDLYAVHLDDPDVLAAFAKADTIGVFQFESGGMRRLLKSLAAGGDLTFEDLVATTALFRPGPMKSGLMDNYVAIRQGALLPSYPHPSMKPALERTHSVIIYQEQVMQVARDLAGFSMAEADGLRKAMGKKDKDKMAQQRDKWVSGCLTHSGVDEDIAGHLFDQVEAFAGYGFNRSHAVEYTIISFWSMWLKVKYPVEFFAAALTVLGEDKTFGLVGNADQHGIRVAPPDVNISTARYEIGYDVPRQKTVLYAPLQAVKGLSEKGAASILEARTAGAFKDSKDFEARVNRRVVNSRTRDTLATVGALASIDTAALSADHPDRLRAQKTLLPGLMIESVLAERMVSNNPEAKAWHVDLVSRYQACDRCSLAGCPHPQTVWGANPRFMVITDSPNFSEEKAGALTKGVASEELKKAMHAVGMGLRDAYFTTLVKSGKPKGMKVLTNEVLIGCTDYLKEEIDRLKPPVIVALGSSTIRYLLPDVKGTMEELTGQTHYRSDLDATIVCGFNPQMIHFDHSRAENLVEVFRKAAEIVGLGGIITKS